ncbi:MAG TPA: anti-sigma factor [Candidatus Limnocylindria bacterium]
MDHADALELLELAAAEPGGVDAWLRGTSPEAEQARSHLAACQACRAELTSLRESTATIRDVIREMPATELRGRTLDLVAATGRDRPALAGAADRPARPLRRFSLRGLLPAVALSAVAAATLAGVLVWRAVDLRINAADAQIEEQREALAGLTLVTDWTLRVGAAPDARLLRLEAPASGSGSGTVLYSAASGELVMMAADLPAAPDGYEYRCWIDQGSGPERIGKMYQVGGVAYWGGAVDRLRGISGHFRMGVTLASEDGDSPAGNEVLRGST